MPEQRLIYDPSRKEGPMEVVCWGSGSCTTIEAILQYQHDLEQESEQEGESGPLFRVAALVTNTVESKAHLIAQREGIPLVYVDFPDFVAECGLDPRKKKDRKDGRMRMEYDQAVLEALVQLSRDRGFDIDLNCLAGYMLAQTTVLTGYFQERTINSHPSKLAKLQQGEDGKMHRAYTGDNAVLDAIVAGETHTYTSIHIVRDQVDAGEILVTSAPLAVDEGSMRIIDEIINTIPEEAKREWLARHYEERRTKKSLRTFSDEHMRKMLIREYIAPTHQNKQKIVCDYPSYLFAIGNIARGNFALRYDDKELHTVLFNGEPMPYNGVQLNGVE